MKSLLYITRKRAWYTGKMFNWADGNLTRVFQQLKDDYRIKVLRVLLGDDVCYVAGFKWVKAETPSRDNVLSASAGLMPFKIDEKCFDWRKFDKAGEIWIQIVCVERDLMEVVTEAASQSGIKVDLVIPTSILVAERSVQGPDPMIIKWQGIENFSIVVVGGVVDMVSKDASDELLNTYAKNKWNLAVNPEQILINEKKFDLVAAAFSEKNRGGDFGVLNIPLLERGESVGPAQSIGGVALPKELEMSLESVIAKEKRVKRLKAFGGLLLLAILVSLAVWYFVNKGRDAQVVYPTPEPSIVLMATPEPILASPEELAGYFINVLNGSGVKGAAAKIKEDLVDIGFLNVGVGNTSTTKVSSVEFKDSVSHEAVAKVTGVLGEMTSDSVDYLPESSKYDLVIVIGKDSTVSGLRE